MSFTKDPEAVLDWAFDWSDWLEIGETISSYTITVANITKDSDSEAAGVVTTFLSGGTDGETASVLCEIVTSAARNDQRTIRIAIRNR